MTDRPTKHAAFHLAVWRALARRSHEMLGSTLRSHRSGATQDERGINAAFMSSLSFTHLAGSRPAEGRRGAYLRACTVRCVPLGLASLTCSQPTFQLE
jgi:hypothetical protein